MKRNGPRMNGRKFRQNPWKVIALARGCFRNDTLNCRFHMPFFSFHFISYMAILKCIFSFMLAIMLVICDMSEVIVTNSQSHSFFHTNRIAS